MTWKLNFRGEFLENIKESKLCSSPIIQTYPNFTRDVALPEHQIHISIWLRLGTSNKTLNDTENVQLQYALIYSFEMNTSNMFTTKECIKCINSWESVSNWVIWKECITWVRLKRMHHISSFEKNASHRFVWKECIKLIHVKIMHLTRSFSSF